MLRLEDMERTVLRRKYIRTDPQIKGKQALSVWVGSGAKGPVPSCLLPAL